MKVRLATQEELPEVIKNLKTLWIMHGKNNPKFLNYEKMQKYTDSRIRNYLKVCFDKNGKSFLYVADNQGVIAGFLKVDIVEIQNFFTHRRVLYIDDIFVNDTFRGKGVSKLLLSEAEKLAKKRRIRMIKARIYSFNTPAQKMAAAIGLTPLYSEYFKNLK